MDKITKSLLDIFSSLYEIEDLEELKRFKYFSNYAISSKLFRGSFDIEDIFCGSDREYSIDGICLVINGQLITSEEELDDIVDNISYLDVDIAFIRTINSTSFNAKEIDGFIRGVKSFLDDDLLLVKSEKINKMHKMWNLIIKDSSEMINRRPICRVYYVCAGRLKYDESIESLVSRGKNEIEDIGICEEVNVILLGASEIQKLYHETKNKLSSTVKFQNRITLPDIKGVSEAYLGVIPFIEYMRLIQDENNTIYNIFNDNVRDFQGENTVNIKIKQTLEESKFELFCLLNNGVTLVASSLTPAGDKFTIRDYQIVNGCQTSHVLHGCQNIEGVENVFVPIKIIVTEDEEVKTSITLATNSQTEVKTEQLQSLNIFQKKLEDYFGAEKGPLPLFYERRSQQYNSDSRIKKAQIISIPIQIKSFASMFLGSPHLVSGYYSNLVKRFSDKMFSENHRCAPYYVSALAYYRIEQFFKNGDIEKRYKKIRFHMLFLVRLLAMGEKLPEFDSEEIDELCEEFKEKLLDNEKSLEMFKEARRIFELSGIDLYQRQYKADRETSMLIKSFQENKI